MKRQMTLDGFSFVKTKQRYEILYFLFLCMHVVSWVLKRNTELTTKLYNRSFIVQALI